MGKKTPSPTVLDRAVNGLEDITYMTLCLGGILSGSLSLTCWILADALNRLSVTRRPPEPPFYADPGEAPRNP